jgi:hypothetical protein
VLTLLNSSGLAGGLSYARCSRAGLRPARDERLILRRPLDSIDNEGRHWPSGRFQSQPELLLNRRKQLRLGGRIRSRWPAQHPTEYGLVGREFEIEIVPSSPVLPTTGRSSAARCITDANSAIVV